MPECAPAFGVRQPYAAFMKRWSKPYGYSCPELKAGTATSHTESSKDYFQYNPERLNPSRATGQMQRDWHERFEKLHAYHRTSRPPHQLPYSDAVCHSSFGPGQP